MIVVNKYFARRRKRKFFSTFSPRKHRKDRLEGFSVSSVYVDTKLCHAAPFFLFYLLGGGQTFLFILTHVILRNSTASRAVVGRGERIVLRSACASLFEKQRGRPARSEARCGRKLLIFSFSPSFRCRLRCAPKKIG